MKFPELTMFIKEERHVGNCGTYCILKRLLLLVSDDPVSSETAGSLSCRVGALWGFEVDGRASLDATTPRAG